MLPSSQPPDSQGSMVVGPVGVVVDTVALVGSWVISSSPQPLETTVRLRAMRKELAYRGWGTSSRGLCIIRLHRIERRENHDRLSLRVERRDVKPHNGVQFGGSRWRWLPRSVRSPPDRERARRASREKGPACGDLLCQNAAAVRRFGGALVLMNACKVARAEHLLSGFAGWAPPFLGAGARARGHAGAVVAPLWSVGGGAAMRFAEGFYTALLAGASFSVVKLARERARKLGDPTWLADVVYAAAKWSYNCPRTGQRAGRRLLRIVPSPVDSELAAKTREARHTN
ncbi:MAG TPA: CHAT domain-containing protein [Nannocystis exedens]|nr:CHAT domain-containing protein [Nannocystis exedens]